MEKFNFKKIILILFFSLILLTLTINVIGFINDVYGTEIGKYLSIYNIIVLCIEVVLYKYLNGPFAKK